MKTRALHRLLAVTLVGLFSVPAVAQYTREASATKKIDEAINNHYLMMQLDKAESLLTGTVAACEDKCSPQTKAKAWMYVGIVRGSGNADQVGAAEAFKTAKTIDPAVQLDVALATPETKETFDATAGDGTAAPAPVAPAPAAPVAAGPAPGAAPPPVGIPGDMLCSPQGSPIQTGMPIPLSCSTDADAMEGFVKFKEPASEDWKKVTLQNFDGQWQAEIPCKFTSAAGELQFYVGMKNQGGDYVDQFGSKKDPATIVLAEQGAAPAFPGQAPVTRCADAGGASDCPPDFPGCESSTDTKQCGDLDWGAACSNSGQCKCGLLCESGQCATAPSCTTNEECDTGSCVDGLCSVVDDGGGGATGPFKRHWLGLTVGMDLMPLGGNNLCSSDEDFQASYGIQCYGSGPDRQFPEDVNIGTGLAPGQLRVKLGYDFAVTHHLGLGARVGMGFLNSHPAAADEPAFLPIHGELRGTYTFTSLAHEGLRPALYLAGGFAEANAKLVAEDTRVYKVAGRIFAAPGGSMGYYFAPNMGINLDVQLMLLFPAGGMAMALHPALNFTYGL